MTSRLASPIVRQLEDTYQAIRANHPDLPDNVVFVLGQGAGRSGTTWGHFATHRWTPAGVKRHSGGSIPEVMISAECLGQGADRVFTTLLHEAVHAIAHAREIKDTSRQGRYHNRKFIALAEELGMAYEHEGPDPRIGWSDVALTAETRAAYALDIQAIEAVIKVAADMGLSMEEAPKKLRRVMVVVFDNADEVEMSPSLYEKLVEHLDEHEAYEEER